MSVDPQLALVIFILVCASLLIPPFFPAWREWRRPTDRQSLRMAVGEDNQASLLRKLRQQMTLLVGSGSPLAFESLDQALLRSREPPSSAPHKPVNLKGTTQTGDGTRRRSPVYAATDLQLREGSDLTDVLADGHLLLGPNSRVSGSAHAEKTLLLGESSVVSRNLSSEHGIALAWACCFERVHAPVIVFGQASPRNRLVPNQTSAELPSHGSLPSAQPWGKDGWRVEGDCVIEKGLHFKGSLVVTGVLSIGAGAMVEGDVKAHKGVVIGQRAQVTGGVFSDNGIRVFNNAVIGGPVLSESVLQLGEGVRLGSLLAPTSASANVILAGNGVMVFGSVWAVQAGVVWGNT